MSNTNKILVTGATSAFGSMLIQNLIATGADVRAFVHNESKAQRLREAGVEIVVGDYLQPETLDAALQGVNKICLHTPLVPGTATMACNVIAAAKRAGKPHIVRMSEATPEPVSAVRTGLLHAQVNAELEASGLPYTSLRLTFYMQNALWAAAAVVSAGMIYMPLKDAKFVMLDMRDASEAAAKVLITESHENQTYVLTSPALLSFHDVARSISKALGRDVKYVNVPTAAALEAFVGMGAPRWLAEAFCEYFENYCAGGSANPTNDFEKLTGHLPRSLDTFACDFSQYFGKS